MEQEFTGTYSPQDNKLRLYALERLDAETYAKAKACGFKWAPAQKLFVAPMWTPEREDFLLSLVDYIEDETQTMEERAAERAERFNVYSEKRAKDAEYAEQAAGRIMEHIPPGQPILIGHHSQRRAERDRDKIEASLQKAAKNWETAAYWEERAAASQHHAKYKERIDVRLRRIKGLEADKRKNDRYLSMNMERLAFFQDNRTDEKALILAFRVGRYDFSSTSSRLVEYDYKSGDYVLMHPIDKCLEMGIRACEANIKHRKRWINHYENRIAYERACLGDYVEPEKVKIKRPALAPLVNFDAPNSHHMTAAEWKIASRYDSYHVQPMNHEGKRADWQSKAAYRQRWVSRGFALRDSQPVFITDMKITMPPVQAPEAVTA